MDDNALAARYGFKWPQRRMPPGKLWPVSRLLENLVQSRPALAFLPRNTPTMPDIALLLGPVVFEDFEVPAHINVGGGQRLAVHKLVGGARVIDSLGRDDAEICFSGTFSGSDATIRARTLDTLRAAGQPLPLTWDVFYYTVVISRFEADYRNGWWIPYRITCTVLRDEASALIQTVVSLATSALSDIGAAVSQASSAGLDLSGAQTALAAPDATQRGTAAYTTAQASLGGAQASIGQSISSAEATLSGAGLGTAGSAGAGITGLSSSLNASQQLAALTAAQAYTGRAAINLANAST